MIVSVKYADRFTKNGKSDSQAKKALSKYILTYKM